jgi:DNA-binding CsgD family transcriptional regulator
VTTRIRTSTHPWTTAQEEELRRLARANVPPSEIAVRLSRTPEQVFEHGYELGLTLPRAQQAKDERETRR